MGCDVACSALPFFLYSSYETVRNKELLFCAKTLPIFYAFIFILIVGLGYIVCLLTIILGLHIMVDRALDRAE